ncbi:hypothetical protein HAX54_003434 [Datura stramonium]|uniref:Uncharacterized protein n=1 Tax=Datura stramonium TaxID=4076 RepID=A0ABS8WUD3_DATST|nr:hypothetical protein [Datura stramonium]
MGFEKWGEFHPVWRVHGLGQSMGQSTFQWYCIPAPVLDLQRRTSLLKGSSKCRFAHSCSVFCFWPAPGLRLADAHLCFVGDLKGRHRSPSVSPSFLVLPCTWAAICA